MENEPEVLRVKPLQVPPQKRKIFFSLPVPTLQCFQCYLEAYAQIYGKEADPSFVANQIFTMFFESDKAFNTFRKKNRLNIPAAG